MSKTLIIGGVAGGATAAARLRRLDEGMEIVLLERGDYISYANCGLPYYIGDVIKEREALLLQTPEAMKKKFNIDVRVRSEAVFIDKENSKVKIVTKDGSTYEESYDDLIIATGSSPLKPPIPGIDGEGIYTLWTIPDTDRIREVVDLKKPRTAAVIGGGFIGLEMAENLHKRGVHVSIVEAQNQVMAPIDFEMAQMLHENMVNNGVDLRLGDGVKEFHSHKDFVEISLSSGDSLKVDMVILSIGVRPNSQIAKEAGLELNQRGGVKVDKTLQTSHSNIWAVGDVIEIENFISKEAGMIPLAGPANKQGRIVANNIVAQRRKEALEKYEGTMGTSIAQVFDFTVGAVGLNEKVLKMMGKVKDKDYHTAIITQKSHAGYYPMATTMTIKMIFDQTGKIYGAQAVGQEGVDKRIDVIATTIRLNGTIEDLKQLELAYAPPYSSAKDPVNMLGFVAENILNKLVTFRTAEEVDQGKKEGSILVLDITEDVERSVWSMEGSKHIPMGELRQRLHELPKDKEICTYCAIGVRSYNAARVLLQSGFDKVSVLEAGTGFYKSSSFDIKSSNRKNQYPAQERRGSEPSSLNKGSSADIKIIDCCGLQCPGPIMKVNEALNSMNAGEVMKVSATDMGFARDVESWCKRTGNTYLGSTKQGLEHIVTIQKGENSAAEGATCCPSNLVPDGSIVQGKTMIVFDGDLDKVIASFIIANGAAAMGRPVTMFFTFWGLNALRKSRPVPVKKNMMEKMFGIMMPRGIHKLKLSKMNMGGLGTKMMKAVMKEKNVASLEELMKSAMKNGVKIVACTMSMDVMGIRKEELIDGVELAGVATYLSDAELSNVNLFI